MEVKTYTLKSELLHPLIWSNGHITHRETVLVRICTNTGIVGWGETGNSLASSVIQQGLTPLLIGQDPMNRMYLWQKMYGLFYSSNSACGLAMCAISAIDIALWDIAGKATNLPVYQLLGGRLRQKVSVYATGLYYTVNNCLSRLQEEANSYVEQSFQAVKMKIGGLDLAEDRKRVVAVREAIGSDIKLMVDANQSYSPALAIQMGQHLADLDIHWFEEPVAAHDLGLYLEVKRKLPIPLAGGENFHSGYNFRDYLAERALDIAQPDVGNIGGLTEIVKVAAMSQSFGVQLCPHAWGTPVLTAATIHLCAGLSPCPFVLAPKNYLQEPIMELDCTPNPIRDQLCGDVFRPCDGFLDVPEEPGLGVKVDEQALEYLTN